MSTTPPDYGEPWQYTSIRNCIRDRHGVLQNLEDSLRDRSLECVNACTGMSNPVEEIPTLRNRLKTAERELAIAKAERDHYRRQSERLIKTREALMTAFGAASEALAYYASCAEQGALHLALGSMAEEALKKLQTATLPVPLVNEVNLVQPAAPDDAPLIREDGSDDDFIRLHHQVMQELLAEGPAASPAAPPHPPASTDDTPHSSAPESAQSNSSPAPSKTPPAATEYSP